MLDPAQIIDHRNVCRNLEMKNTKIVLVSRCVVIVEDNRRKAIRVRNRKEVYCLVTNCSCDLYNGYNQDLNCVLDRNVF